MHVFNVFMGFDETFWIYAFLNSFLLFFRYSFFGMKLHEAQEYRQSLFEDDSEFIYNFYS